MDHLLTLLSLCEKIQKRLLLKGRSLQNDFIILKLYDLVIQNPGLPVRKLLFAYKRLLANPSMDRQFPNRLEKPLKSSSKLVLSKS